MKKTGSLNDDIEKYKEILRHSAKLERDIPPRSVVGSHKKARVSKRKTKLKKTKNIEVGIPRPQYGGPYRQANADEEDKSKNLGEISVSVKKLALDSENSYSTLEVKLPAASLASRAVTFKEKVTTQNLYSSMVEKIRDASNDIDFGMAWRLLPKNIYQEKKRFSLENSGADKLLWQMQTAAFSDDIDLFFRQISGKPVENAHSLPLI